MAFGIFGRALFADQRDSEQGEDGLEPPPDDFVKAQVIKIGQLFSDRYRFRLPWFQRAYAWREEHVGRLLSDIFHAMKSENGRYFLGQIRIATSEFEETGSVSLIDGQQRLLTLTILFALLRDLAEDQETKQRAGSAVQFDAGDVKDGDGDYRMVPQPLLEAFFSSFVQEPGRSLRECEDDVMALSESERLILQNRDHLRAQLLEVVPDEEQRAEFMSFVLDDCYILVVAVRDPEEAWSMLAVEEETGLDFHSSERTKISLIGMMPREDQEEAGRLWGECQSVVDADDLCRLLGFVRTIKLRRRSAKPVEKDLAQYFKINQNGLSFLRDELLMRARHFAPLKRQAIASGEAQVATAYRLRTLFWLEQTYWIPPALYWLSERGGDDLQTPDFFFLLERLAWLLRLAGADPTEQERRFINVISDIDGVESPRTMRTLNIDPKYRSAALAHLGSRTFYAKHYCAAVLQLLTYRLESNPDSVDFSSYTVEHVLPRNPNRAAEWRAEFPTRVDVGNYANRLGNLVLLTPADNQLAAAQDYSAKRAIFAESGLALAAGAALAYNAWTPDTIVARTEELIDVLFADWQLGTAASV